MATNVSDNVKSANEDPVNADKDLQDTEINDHDNQLTEGNKSEAASTVSKKISTLKNNKKAAKSRLTRTKKTLHDMLQNRPEDAPLPSKSSLRILSTKLSSEMNIISKIICSLREIYATSEEDEDNVTVVESLDKELDDIGALVDSLTSSIKEHIEQRLAQGENESVSHSHKSNKSGGKSVQSKMSSLGKSEASQLPAIVEQKQLEAKEAEERLLQMEQEQKEKEKELQNVAGELQLTKQRTEEARKVAKLNKSRAEQAERLLVENDADTVKDFLADHDLENKLPSKEASGRPIGARTLAPIKLKGVDIPKFSGEDKADYEPWKAAFMSMVDIQNISVGEKMLRLQGSLSGKALTMIKDLGYSEAAYERAKFKLEKKYGGEKRLQIKHLTTLRNWPKVRSRHLKDVEEFQALLERILITVKDCGSLQDQSLNLSAKEKLSEEDIQAYKFWLLDHSREDCFESQVEWVELKAEVMEEAREETDRGQKPDKHGDSHHERKRFRGFNTRNPTKGCVVNTCKEDHPPWVCEAFKKLSVKNRKELITKAGRCYRCLAAGHLSKSCQRARRCGVEGCQSSNHSPYLHESSPSDQVDRSNQTTPPRAPPFVPRQNSLNSPTDDFSAQQRTHKTSNVDSVSLMVLPALISNGRKSLKVNVMLDPCSTSSYITEAAANELELNGQPLNLTIAGTGGTEVQKQSRRVELSVVNLNGRFTAPLQAYVLDDVANDTPAIHWSKLKERWPHLRDVPFENVSRRRRIDAMIGSDHPIFHMVLNEIPGAEPNDPIGRLTNLGWVCFGPTLVENFRRDSHSYFSRTYRSRVADQRQPPDDAIRKFWELDAIGIKEETRPAMTAEENAAVKKVSETLKFLNGRYEIGIPWKDEEPNFVNNYEAAFARLESQEKSLRKKGPEVMQAYNHIFEEYERKGYIQEVRKSDVKEQWFLPHFPVLRPEKETTKVRTVFDAAMEHEGKSLNSAIRPGPKLQREIVDVLIRFRKAPVALTADIAEMFLQVSLREQDRPYHRFLWRNYDSTRQPKVYEFRRLLFGNTASPFCAQYVLHTHAQTHAAEFPAAAEAVDDSMYVDDLLDSCETVQDAITLQSELSDLLASGGFRLRKWASNNLEVLCHIPEEDRLPSLEINEQETPSTKTLGVSWNAKADIFTFLVKRRDPNEVPTKRNVISTIAALYDPLQFLSPFVMRAKVLLQEIWTAGITWDDVLPDELRRKWEQWLSELSQLSNVAVPRCLRRANPNQTQLHLFSDASNAAYAAVAYLVCQYRDYTISSCLIASKCRVAPVKAITIPRLELMGAILSARLSQTILHVLTVDRVLFWTDSENVWHWVRNQSREFKPFVANRIGEIQRLSDPDQWHHVPGALNPADLATRGLSAEQLALSEFWMEGPKFLKDGEPAWPTPKDQKLPVPESFERRATTQSHLTQDHDFPSIDLCRFSSLEHLLRVTGWIRRFITNCKTLELTDRNYSKTLSMAEISEAERLWIRKVQAEAFPKGVREGSLARLSPMKGSDGVLRIDGRLQYADELPYSTRCPVLLPKDHHFTQLIVLHAHRTLGHGSGTEHTLTQLRTKFWIPQGRRVVRNVVERCPECRRRFSTKPAGQMMAPLPRSRLSSMRAFEKVGVDYAGPFKTKQGRGTIRAKRYLCLFTCLTTRAVHLEMSYSLDTDSFINAFYRMTSRRGTPRYVISDNGTNFVGAERELRELVESLNKEKIIQQTTKFHPVEWEFNPPIAPHFGGVFEALVKSAKKAIRAILGDADVWDEELHTAICGAERLMNSRPITYVSSDHNDLSPLTPNHFLAGQLGGQFAPEALDETVYNPKKRWHRVQQLLKMFWKRWRREFLPRINLRNK